LEASFLEAYHPESEVQQATSEPTPTFGRFLLDLMETVLLAVILFLGINAVSARVRVDGFSMRPTLQDGEYVLVNKLAYRMGPPQRGDIIVFRFPMDPQQDLIKRVIGLSGDRVSISDGQVSVNGKALNEPYIAAAPTYTGTWNIPEGYLFVLGDNRNDSSDSHSWGLVPMQNVIGKAILIYWPPLEWDLINHMKIAALLPGKL
jgi:signal peptidase I